MIKKFYLHIYGVLLAFIIAAISWWVLAPIKILQVFGPSIFSIFIGMFIGSLTTLPKQFEVGLQFTAKKVLQLSIILLGFEMNINQVLITGKQSLLVMGTTIFIALFAAFLIGRLLKLDSNTTILIGVGTAICGGSAIAATAPILHADDKEVAHSISTIFLFNIVAVFLFPILGYAFHMSQNGFGIWAGTAVNDTSSVVATAATYGASALQVATIVKLTRTLMIIPITLFLSFYMQKKNATGDYKGKFNFIKIFPWFLLGFVISSIICTVFPADFVFYKQLSQMGKFCIAMAMAAIGLKTNLFSLLRNGVKPILLGLCCWICVSVTSLLVQYFLGII